MPKKFGEFIEMHDRLIVRGKDGFFRDKDGVIYALAEEDNSIDKKTRLGVGVFSLPECDSLNDAAKAHDFAYSSSVFQEYHTRKEADNILKNQLFLLAGNNPIKKAKAYIIYKISRLFGSFFWEGK